MLGGEGLVGRAVISGLVVGTCINAEHREVAGMAWPSPVVGFTSEFSYVFWGSTHQADVAVHLVVHGKVLVSVREHGDINNVVLFFVAKGFDQRILGCFEVFGNGFGARCFVLVDAGICENAAGNVFNFAEQSDLESDFTLFRLGLSPESVRKDIVLRGSDALDGIITTVVVGEEHAL